MVFMIKIIILLLAVKTIKCVDNKDKEKEEHVRPIDDRVYDNLKQCLINGETPKLGHTYTKEERRIYGLIKHGKVKVSEIFDPIKKTKDKRIVTKNDKIVPKCGEVADIVRFYYEVYKGEGANKLHCRINQHYSGISRRYIQSWLNKSKHHWQLNPQFKNKTPLKPVVSKTVQSHHQFDLVSMENYPAKSGVKVYRYILSVLDIFSRYLQLRPLERKEPKEVLVHLKKMYRYILKIICRNRSEFYKKAVSS